MNKHYYDEDYRESNRDKAIRPKRGYGYCLCDRTQMGEWSKCPVCHRRNGRYRLKK